MIKNIKKIMNSYNKRFNEAEKLTPLENLIKQDAKVTDRKEFKGHITAGAILINSEKKFLMIHHIGLKKWLFPGGHIEEYDSSIKEASLRELLEETGISKNYIVPFDNWIDEEPIHIDCHTIPKSIPKNEEEHEHWDFRFLFQTNKEEVVLQEEEVNDFEWVNIEKVPTDIVTQLKKIGII